MHRLYTLLISILAVFAPIQSVVVAVAIFIMVDLILGLWAAKKRGEMITSAGLRRTISKLLIYEFVVVLGFVAETWLTGPVVPIVKIISGYIGITELKSIMENLDEINGQSILKGLIQKLGSDNDPKQ